MAEKPDTPYSQSVSPIKNRPAILRAVSSLTAIRNSDHRSTSAILSIPIRRMGRCHITVVEYQRVPNHLDHSQAWTDSTPL